jgi:parvulin-like peptidyl-prolyl isomerase
LRIWKRLVIWLVLGLLIGCNTSGKPTPTLVPTSLIPSAISTLAPASAETPVPASAETPVPAPTETPVPPPTETPVPTPTEVPLAARVNGQPLLLADFEREVVRAGDAATRQQVLDKMIKMVLLEQAAAAAGIVVTDEEVDATIQADIDAVGGREVFEARLASNNMTEDEYRAEAQAELLAQRVQLQISEELPATAEHVHARHILVATQQEAEAILAQLQNGADFSTLAQTYSLDVSTRDRGGDLGFFPRGLLLAPELEEAAFALAPGQISGVVHSDLLGYHIVQALEREERPINEQDREMIKANQREIIRRWREQIWADATVERFIEP